MCVQYHITGGTLDRRFRFFFFAKNDFFLKLVEEYQNSEPQRASFPRILLWEDWGVENTRFMAYGMQPRWLRLAPRFTSSQAFIFVSLVSMLLARGLLLTNLGSFPCGRYVHGMKVVCPPYMSDRHEWACVLEVFDFNVHPKKLPETDIINRTLDLAHTSGDGVDEDTGAGVRERADDSYSEALAPLSPSPPSSSSNPPSVRPTSHGSSSTITHEVSYTVHTEPSRISASGVFVSDVISKLPYTHAVRKDLCAVYSGFMIDDERIVGLKVGTIFFLDVHFIE